MLRLLKQTGGSEKPPDKALSTPADTVAASGPHGQSTRGNTGTARSLDCDNLWERIPENHPMQGFPLQRATFPHDGEAFPVSRPTVWRDGYVTIVFSMAGRRACPTTTLDRACS